MRRLILALLLSISIVSAQTVKIIGKRATGGGGGGGFCSGSFTICDEFSTNTIANYTAFNTSTGWAINSGQLFGPTNTGGILLHNTVTPSTDQYAIMRFVTPSVDGDTGIVLGGGSGGADADCIYYSSNRMWWGRCATTGTPFQGDVADCTVTPVGDQYVIAKKVGTATTRVISIWITATQPTGAPTGTPTCSFNTGVAPYYTFSSPATAGNCDALTCTPSSTVTGGNRIGVFAGTSAPIRDYDNFAGGSP